jgi:hypothetical protein
MAHAGVEMTNKLAYELIDQCLQIDRRVRGDERHFDQSALLNLMATLRLRRGTVSITGVVHKARDLVGDLPLNKDCEYRVRVALREVMEGLLTGALNPRQPWVRV